MAVFDDDIHLSTRATRRSTDGASRFLDSVGGGLLPRLRTRADQLLVNIGVPERVTGATCMDKASHVTTTDGPPQDSVYRVIKVIAIHPDSWEDAAAVAIMDATKTIPDLRVARVVALDTVVGNGSVESFRVSLSISYRIDRRRVNTAGANQVVHRCLVVANRTLGGSALKAAMRERLAKGPVEVHVVVPVLASAGRLALGMDPLSPGYVMPDATEVAEAAAHAETEARERLTIALAELAAMGADASGEVGSADPVRAISTVLARSVFDEILLCTLPASGSRWLKLDLPARVQRHCRQPVTILTAPE